jgi:hypothetical protein
MTAPLFSRVRKGDFAEPEVYPYVYDRNIEARMSSAFVGGTKVGFLFHIISIKNLRFLTLLQLQHLALIPKYSAKQLNKRLSFFV